MKGRFAKLIIGITLGFLPIFGASAEYESGATLLNYCEAKRGTFESGICLGYVMGLADYDVTAAEAKGAFFCIPKDVSNGQLMLVITKYLKDNPNELHYTASSIAAYSLHVAFPCPSK